ncbi:MAG: hypothetical protein ACXVKA_12500 [Acidimicrobiia bacterium]
MNSRGWALWLTWLGVLITIAAIGLAVWQQVTVNEPVQHLYGYSVRISLLSDALVPFAAGLLVTGVGRILAVLRLRNAVS